VRLRSTQKLILVLALLLGQWTTLAHGFEHSALASEQGCPFHLLSQFADAGSITAALPALAIPQSAEAPFTPSAPASLGFAPDRPSIRGPPV
jgi:hypothetical protein